MVTTNLSTTEKKKGSKNMVETSYLKQNFKSSHYHSVRPTYPRSLFQAIMSYHKVGRELVLDVGCGTGKATFPMTEYFDTVIGVDPSSKMLEIARREKKMLGKRQVEFTCISGEALSDSFEPKSVDMVVAAESIHWCNRDKLYKQVAQVLKPGGTFAFWFYVQPLFVDHPEAQRVYYKYGWSEEYMGRYLDEDRKRFLLEYGGAELVKTLEGNFASVERHVYDPTVSEYRERTAFHLKKSFTLKEFRDYVYSWSLYASWVSDHPGEDDIADKFIKELREVCNCDEMTELRVEWSTFYCLCTAQ